MSTMFHLLLVVFAFISSSYGMHCPWGAVPGLYNGEQYITSTNCLDAEICSTTIWDCTRDGENKVETRFECEPEALCSHWGTVNICIDKTEAARIDPRHADKTVHNVTVCCGDKDFVLNVHRQ